MEIELLTSRHAEQIAGVLSCFDRITIQGTLPMLCYADGMTRYLSKRGIRIFDYPQWASQWRDQLRQNAERLAQDNGLTIDYIRKKNFRKQDKIQQILKQRGDRPGLVWIFSALEPCTTYKPWYNKSERRAYLRFDDGKCLHYYFYFLDEELGLCYVRVPTWCPFRLQFYCNGHNRLAAQLTQHGIGYAQIDNAFVAIDDFTRAQQLANQWDSSWLQRRLDQFAARYCPILQQLEQNYHWSLVTVEYATDIVFRRQADLAAIYPHLLRTAIHALTPDNIATFLGKKLTGHYQAEMGNRYNVRIAGARGRHQMGKVSLKMYDKFGQMLRLETTADDVTFFKHYRKVEQRDGQLVRKFAAMKKSIYSLGALRELLEASNRRYLQFVSAIEDRRGSTRRLRKLCRTLREAGRGYRGFNFFDEQDQKLLETIARGEYNISGLSNKQLRLHLSDHNSGQITRILKRLRMHGLIKKAARCYKYYLTALGKQVITLGLKLKELVILPDLAALPARR